MSKSKANERLQRLYKRVSATWSVLNATGTGKGRTEPFTATDAYKLCKQIVEEYEKEENEEC